MTNKYVLDPATGLPELPNGQFWRVEPDLRSSSARVCVCLMDVRAPVPPKHWWNKPSGPEIYIKGRVTIGEYFIRDGEKFFAEQQKDVPGRFRMERVFGFSYVDRSITAESILATAMEALDQIQAVRIAKIEEQRISELMGDYPPKVLP